MTTPRKSRAKAVQPPADAPSEPTEPEPAKAKARVRTKKVVVPVIVVEQQPEEQVEQVEQPAVVVVEVDTVVTEEAGEDVGREPVVLQLNIPDSRMTEIVNYTSTTKEQSNVDPEPYAPGNAFTPMMNIEETSFKTTNDRGGGSHTMICYWCCHSIVDTEYGMPIRYDSVHNSFTLYGCFCSLECSAAHNFATHMGCDRAWEIHSWIQLMARRYGFSGRVRPAPSKYLLDIFDGPLTIEEFRNAHKGLARTYIQNIPPFIHITSQMEVLNTSFMTKAA